jgi:hypothetical protein
MFIFPDCDILFHLFRICPGTSDVAQVGSLVNGHHPDTRFPGLYIATSDNN